MVMTALLFLLQTFLRISSVAIAIITIYYVVALVKFIYEAIQNLGEDAVRFGIILLIIFLMIAIPANTALFYLIW